METVVAINQRHGALLLRLCCLVFFFAMTHPVSAASTTTVPVHDQAAVRTSIENVFSDTPAMVAVAKCESNFRQFTDAGNVFRGGYNNQMIGVFQFYKSVHSTAALALGFDIAALDGNIGYAKHVYDTQGITPWNASKTCWEAELAKNSAPNVDTNATRERLLKQIALLQQLIALLQK
ncbi:hypothetical protein KC887_03325 [Candidatus Kaiserbacteria bacterium]|nr:hypothetical protein [Candidatus Kaiserbacteria bacterium]